MSVKSLEGINSHAEIETSVAAQIEICFSEEWFLAKDEDFPNQTVIRSEDTSRIIAVVDDVDEVDKAYAQSIILSHNCYCDLVEALKECVEVYESKKNEQETGHLWPDPNHIFHAKAAIAKAESFK